MTNVPTGNNYQISLAVCWPFGFITFLLTLYFCLNVKMKQSLPPESINCLTKPISFCRGLTFGGI